MTTYDEFYRQKDFIHFAHDLTYIRFLREFLPDPLNSRILDVGCGRGYWSHLFQTNGVGQVVGIDISQAGLKNARISSPDIAYFLADARNLHFPDRTFDMIFCQGLSLFNIDDLSTARTTGLELFRCLKDSGILVFAYTTNFTGTIKGGWRQHKAETILDFLQSLDCEIKSTYLVERAILLRILGARAIKSHLLKKALPLVCRVSGFPVTMVCLAGKKRL